jgi:hypothetical protein
MVVDPIQLLKQLEPAVRPVAAPGAKRDPNAPLERQSFDELLAMVSRGAVSSGRSIDVRDDANLREPLDRDALDRLAAAADKAEAAGAQRAVMLIDGRGLVMDIAGRAITNELDAVRSRDPILIDAAVYVPREHELEKTMRLSPPMAGLIRPGAAASSNDAAETAARTEPISSKPTDRPARVAG